VFTEPLLINGLLNPVVPPLFGADDIENTASSIVAYSTAFTELLPDNTLIKSVTIFYKFWGMNDVSHIWALNEIEAHYVLNLKHNIRSNLQSKFQPQEFISVRGTESFMEYVTHSSYHFNAMDSI
jgi:hypothetical protein